MAEFTAGQEVYTLSGNKAEYVVPSNYNRHLVRLIVVRREDGYDEEYYTDRVTEVDHVFATPPIDVVDARMKELLEDESDLKNNLKNLRADIKDTEQSILRRKQAFAKHRALDRLEDFIEGKITHVLIIEYGKPRIQSLEDALHKEYNYDRSLKLVTLYGDSKGNLTWQLDYYSGSSGNGSAYLFPFLSEQAALDHTVKLCDQAIADWRNKTKLEPQIYWEPRIDAYAAADFLEARGLSINEDIKQVRKANAIKAAEDSRNNYARLLAEAEEKLKTAKGE